MKHLVLLILTGSFLSTSLFAQNSTILVPIHHMFDGMRAGDSSMIASAFTKNATLESYIASDEGVKTHTTKASEFIKSAGQPHDKVWNEVIWSYDIRKDGPLATVWTEYTFYHGDRLSHCGVNAFQLIQQDDDWKIARITDTRKRDNCRGLSDENNQEALLQQEIDDQVWRSFRKAYSDFDAELMNSVHHDDVIRASSWSIQIGDEYKSRNAERYQAAKERGDKRTIDFYFESRKTTKTHAVETGYYKVTSTRNNNVNESYGYFHIILKKENDRWQILYDWDTDAINGSKINADWLKDLILFE